MLVSHLQLISLASACAVRSNNPDHARPIAPSLCLLAIFCLERMHGRGMQYLGADPMLLSPISPTNANPTPFHDTPGTPAGPTRRSHELDHAAAHSIFLLLRWASKFRQHGRDLS
jgi:hypothetical protein